MDASQNNKGYKIVIALLLLALAGSGFYIFKLTTQANSLQTQVKNVKTEKENVMIELQQIKDNYDQAISENTTMNDELLAEKEKVVELIKQLENTKNLDASSINKYKQQITALQTKMNSLMQEVDVLKKQNQELTADLDSTKVVLDDSKKYTQELVSQNESLSKTVEVASKISVLNLTSSAYKLRNSGKEIATDKAKRTDMLKINFTIAENNVAKAGDKSYYVQVIDPKNNVVGEKTTIPFGDKTLVYSFISTVKFENKTVNVSQNLAGKDFESGTYFVNIFDNSDVVCKTSFELK